MCIVLREPAEFLAVQIDDREVALIDQFGSMDRPAMRGISADLLLDDLIGDAQNALPVGLPTGVAPRDLISEESGTFGRAVRDQGLLGGEFQLEVIAQEVPQSALDRFGFLFRTIKAEHEVVRITDIVQSSVVRVERVSRSERPDFPAEGLEYFFGFTPLFESPDLCPQTAIFPVVLLPAAPGEFRDKCPFDVLVQLVKVDIREQRADDPALRRTAEGGPVGPLFEVSGLE